jgi:hypothetical protein
MLMRDNGTIFHAQSSTHGNVCEQFLFTFTDKRKVMELGAMGPANTLVFTIQHDLSPTLGQQTFAIVGPITANFERSVIGDCTFTFQPDSTIRSDRHPFRNADYGIVNIDFLGYQVRSDSQKNHA